MKKVLPALMVIGALAMPAVILAACLDYTTESACKDANCMWNPDELKCSGVEVSTPSDVINVINTIGNWIFAIALAIAAIFILLAAFYFITAGGNPEQASKARTLLVNCLIGVALALGAKGLVALVESILGAA